MAGDWIKMRHDLQDDPAVISIAAELQIEEFSVIGRLHKWWSWLDRQSETGDAVSVTEKWIDRYVDAKGFAKCLVAAGWLAGKDGEFSIPNFDRHNGKPAKKRALTALRMQKQRDAERDAKRDAESDARGVTRGEYRYIPPKSPKGGLKADKSARKTPPPLTAPQSAFVAFAKSIGIEPRVGESDPDFRQRVIREAESHNREAA